MIPPARFGVTSWAPTTRTAPPRPTAWVMNGSMVNAASTAPLFTAPAWSGSGSGCTSTSARLRPLRSRSDLQHVVHDRVRGGHGNPQAAQVGRPAVAAAVDVDAAHHQREPVGVRPQAAAVGHDLHVHAASHGVEDGWVQAAGQGHDLAGRQGRQRVRREPEVGQLGLDALGREVAIGPCQDQRRVAQPFEEGDAHARGLRGFRGGRAPGVAVVAASASSSATSAARPR